MGLLFCGLGFGSYRSEEYHLSRAIAMKWHPVVMTTWVGMGCLLVVAGCGRSSTQPGPSAEWRAAAEAGAPVEQARPEELPSESPVPPAGPAVTQAIPSQPEGMPPADQPRPEEAPVLGPMPLPPGPQLAADPFQVPDGPPAELFRYLEKLQFVQPPSQDEAAIQEFRRKLGTAVLTVAEKVLAQPDVATKEESELAVQLKIVALTILKDLGDSGAAESLANLPSELEKSGRGDLAHAARGFLLSRELEDLEDIDGAKLADLGERIRQHFSEMPPTPADAMLALQLFQLLEMRGLKDLLSQIGPDIVKQLASSEDEKLQRLSSILEGVTRRAGLVGNALEISGVTLSGEPLDWASYQGKVVLVTFWATWCAPCRAEIPHLLENYKEYHDRGFDIVAISVDDDREDVVNFLEENSLPWTVLFDRDAPGEKMATKYGVFAIPQMILVGRDGKVVATGVRGHNLRPYLEKLIGPAENN